MKRWIAGTELRLALWALQDAAYAGAPIAISIIVSGVRSRSKWRGIPRSRKAAHDARVWCRTRRRIVKWGRTLTHCTGTRAMRSGAGGGGGIHTIGSIGPLVIDVIIPTGKF